MFRSNSPLGSYAGSIQSNSYSTTDETASQLSGLSRQSAKSLYLQRKAYAASINKKMNKFQYRVEHLFTCELDGKGLRTLSDCVQRLQLLDQMCSVWGQSMLLEARGAHLLLTDVETKEELESVAIADVQELKAVLDVGVYNSLLMVSVRPERRHTATVFMLQCESVRADYVQRDLSRLLSRRREDLGLSSAAEPPVEPFHEEPEDPAVHPVLQWSSPDYEEDNVQVPELVPQEEEEEEEEEALPPPPRKEVPSPQPSNHEEEPSPPLPRPYTEMDRNVDILNHIFSDIEIFVGKIAAVEAKNTKKKKKKKKKKGKAVEGMPPAEEFAECFHKIKFGFNLLGELNGKINNPSAPDLVHSLFSMLVLVTPHCPDDLPPTIVAPLLSPLSIRLMSEEASSEEDLLWQTLGDAWNIPSTQWPEDDEDIPTYTLEFFDGWQPPEVMAAPPPRGGTAAPPPRGGNPSRAPVSRQESPQPAPDQTPSKWMPPPRPQKSRSGQTVLRLMRVKSDFVSRNHRELTVRKGETVELLDMSKRWWKVRNGREEEGFVPNHVLEGDDEQSDELTVMPPVLTKKSKPAEVKAWLEDKGFSKITVRCLGVLSGSMLLGMSREELKTVCPEDGGRVFFQLQAVRSTMTVSGFI
ncbi:epidermal growth factor receptor kinase substrate 8-like protein 3 [Embiotoca jacksoni]|uniref:epidermal growth factor receptor kinase substrate 8-like protein 3 n=1 Tax=Embiotoca jacksoni TaxID=100190 RepID=UPI003703B7F5